MSDRRSQLVLTITTKRPQSYPRADGSPLRLEPGANVVHRRDVETILSSAAGRFAVAKGILQVDQAGARILARRLSIVEEARMRMLAALEGLNDV